MLATRHKEILMILSVIIPYYNPDGDPQTDALLKRAVISARDNLDGIADYEIIVVNDGSQSDPEPAFDTPVIRYIRREHGMLGAARNTGIENARGEYISFLDADDMYMPRAVEVLSREIMGHNADIASSNFIAEQKGAPGILMNVFTTPVTWCHGRIYRAKFLRDNNIRFLDGLRVNEDAYFNLIAHNCTDKKIKLEEVTYLWRDNKNSITRDGGKEEFFKRTWKTYITSQVEALPQIIRIKGYVAPDLLGATLLYVYHYWMIAEHYKVVDIVAEEELLRLKNNPDLIKTLTQEEFWKYIVDNLKGCTIWEDNIIFYKERFCDWMKKYIADSLI